MPKINSQSLLLINAASVLAVASREFLGGLEFLAVPVVAARVGVMNGLFYTQESLETSARAWNGAPVPIGHPANKAGEFLSANHEDFIDDNVGWFDRVSFSPDTQALKGTLLLNIEKMTTLGHKDLLDKLEAGEVVDVSTGLYPNLDGVEGSFNGEYYNSSVISLTPDHLALLPNQTGACSPAKGCGTHLHANHDEGGACCESCASKRKTAQSKPSLFSNAFKVIGKALGFAANENSHNEIHEKIRTTLRASRVDNNWWPYIVDVYDTFFVYESDGLLFKQGYAMDAAEVISFIGDSLQVIVERKYAPVNPVTNQNTNTPNMKPHIIGILAGLLATNAITAEQKTAIEGLPEKALDTIFPEPTNNATVTAPVVPAVNQGGLTSEERELLNLLKANTASAKTGLVERVQKHYTSIPKEVVANMDMLALQGLAGAIPGSAPSNIVDFSGAAGAAGGAPATNAQEDYVPPSILTRTGD